MAILEYDFRVVGANVVDKALSGVERRIVTHNQRLSRQLGTSPTTSKRTPGVAKATIDRNIGRQYEQIGRAARAADLKVHRDRMAHQRREEAAYLRGWGEIARAAQAAERQRHQASLRAAKSEARARARFAVATSGRIGRSAGDTIRGAGMLAGGALSLAGGFAVAGALQTQSREQALASQLANQAGRPGMKGQLLAESRGVRGFTGEEALNAMSGFVAKTGDLDMARKMIQPLADLSLATGANLDDLGNTAGHVFNVLSDQIKDPVELMNQMNEIMGVLAQQGAMGAVEIKDLAQEFGKLGAATRAFEGGAPELLRMAGALGQMAVKRGGAPDAAEAATAVMRMSGDIAEHRKDFAGLGVNIKSSTDPTKLRNPVEIMLDALEKTGGDVLKTAPLFGERADKVFRGVGAVFGEAEKKQKGSGRAAAMAEFNRFAGAKLNPADVQARVASRLDDADIQFKEALKQFNTILGTSLLPTLTRLIPEFAKLLPYVERAAVLFAKFVQGFIDNPVAGIGKLIALKLAADIAMANISSVITKGMTALFAKVGGVGGGVGGGMGGAAGLGAQIGLTAATVILTAGIVNFEKNEAETTAAGHRVLRAEQSMDKDEVRAALVEQRRAVETVSKPGLVEGVFGREAAEFTTARDTSAIATQEEFARRLESRLAKLEALEKFGEQLAKAGVSQESAAKQLSDAAVKLGLAAPNRGNAPSPIKG